METETFWRPEGPLKPMVSAAGPTKARMRMTRQALLSLCLGLWGGCQPKDQEPTPASSIASLPPGSLYTCEAKDLVTKRIMVKSGPSEAWACARALEDCWYKGEGGYENQPAGRECTIVRQYDDQTTAEGVMSGRGWACEVSEVLGGDLRGRTWIRSARTQKLAMEGAMRYCRITKAGNQCQILRCFDADFALPGVRG